MSTRVILAIGIWLSLASHSYANPAGPWQQYQVYNPTVERFTVLNHEKSHLKYNHCSTMAYFKGWYICLWNANTVEIEAHPYQLIYMAMSRDGRSWSEPELCFASTARSKQPIYCNNVQWQPNLIVTGDELWCFWSQITLKKGKPDENFGCYFSRLTDPLGKWDNRKLTWDGDANVDIFGKPYRVFPCQNPARLSSGRVMVPLVLMRPRPDDYPKDPDLQKTLWNSELRMSVMYSDDQGETWQVSQGTIQPEKSYAQWEPTVWEQPGGVLGMFARQQDGRKVVNGGPQWWQTLLYAQSTDGGETWTPLETVPIETVISRMHVIRNDWDSTQAPTVNSRLIMVHNDARHHKPFAIRDRDNLALFFNRGGGNDFVAGTSLTASETCVAYPHMWVKDDNLWVSYTQGVGNSSIKVAKVSPMPDEDNYYIYPRAEVFPATERPGLEDHILHFRGDQKIVSRKIPNLEKKGFSMGMWVRPEIHGVLLDTRTADKKSGILWHLQNGRNSLELPGVGKLRANVYMPFWTWYYLGVTVDVEKGEVSFYSHDYPAEVVKFDPAKLGKLSGQYATIGKPGIKDDSKLGFVGKIRYLGVYADRLLEEKMHNVVRNRYSHELKLKGGTPILKGGVINRGSFYLDPADEKFAQAFWMPPAGKDDTIELINSDDAQLIQFNGAISAGVELAANECADGDKAEIDFEFRVVKGSSMVLCTIGGGDDPARVIVGNGKVYLQSKLQKQPCRVIEKDKWHRVKLVSQADTTQVSVDGGEFSKVKHSSATHWLYLGQGYRSGKESSKTIFQVKVDSVKTRISK